MTAREAGLTYARPGVAAPTSDGVQVQRSSPNLGEDWNFGFRAGLGFVFPHDQWQAQFTYSRLTTNSQTQIEEPFVPTWDPTGIQTDGSGLLPTFTRGSGKWNLIYNRFNLEIGRPFYPTPYISIAPHIGFCATWQKQTLDIEYDTTHTLNVQQGNWGIGIRSGCTTHLNFNSTYGIFTRAAIAALWERIRYQRKDNTTLNINEDFHTATPLIDLAFGIEINPSADEKIRHIAANIGWEMQLWINESYLQNLSYHGSVGDLILQGFFLSVSAIF